MYTDPSGYSVIDILNHILSNWDNIASGTTYNFDNGNLTSITWGSGGSGSQSTGGSGGTGGGTTSTYTYTSFSFIYSRFKTELNRLGFWRALKDAFFVNTKTFTVSNPSSSFIADFAPVNPMGYTASLNGFSEGDGDGGPQGGGGGGSGLPDWTKTTPSERVRFILEAGASSLTKQVNIHSIFNNYAPYSDGSGYGTDLMTPVNVTLGGRQYKAALTIGVLTDVNGKYNPVFNLSINSPKTIKTKYGVATGYNYGHKSQMYLLIYGNDTNAEAFEDWYGY